MSMKRTFAKKVKLELLKTVQIYWLYMRMFVYNLYLLDGTKPTDVKLLTKLYLTKVTYLVFPRVCRKVVVSRQSLEVVRWERSGWDLDIGSRLTLSTEEVGEGFHRGYCGGGWWYLRAKSSSSKSPSEGPTFTSLAKCFRTC